MCAKPTSQPTNATSVHTEETTHQEIPNLSYQFYRRRFCADEWQAVGQIYSFTDSRDGKRRYDQLCKCRSDAWFARHVDTHQVTVLSNACHLRWCPVCRPGLKKFIEEQTLEWLSQQTKPKFITLTLRHSDAPLSHQIDSLYKYFQALRRSKIFSAAVFGGIWFFQVKFNAEDEQWHPHLHILVNSKYIPQSNLSSLWKSITHGSSVVDIRAVHKRQQAIDYVARYASSPCQMSDLPFPRRVELFDSMHGRRICGGFGSAKSLRVRTVPPADKSKWINVGSWWTVTRMASSVPFAEQILSAWAHKTTLPDDVTVADYDQFLDGKDLYEEQLAEPPPLPGLWDQY
jgi:hypothetical protein